MKFTIYILNKKEPRYDEILEKVSIIWKNLSINSDISYFLSWAWVSNWLHSLPRDIKIRLVVMSQHRHPTCAFFLGERQIVRKKIIKSESLFLNSTGFPHFDNLCIEYNTVLCESFHDGIFTKALKKLHMKWDEIHLPAVDELTLPLLIQNLSSYLVHIDDREPSYQVDLKKFSADMDGYLNLLSSNTRRQIRRSYRSYSKLGNISVAVAQNKKQADEIFNELIVLHNKSWRARGQTGVFKSKYFVEFHRELIRRQLQKGDIQLMRISAGKETLACLYNFVYKGVVYYYQSGIKYKDDPHLKPGLVAHTEAILYNAKKGHLIYDFLSGKAQYKQSLSTNERMLIWAKIQRPRVHFRTENFLRKLKSKISSRA